MRFEKWQALGNDYVIVEEPALPGALTPERVRALCARHTGIGADGVLLLGPPAARGGVAALRIFNPDGSEAELSGNGARQACLYLRRRGWIDVDTFSVETAAGEVRARVTGDWTCTLDMGRARLQGEGEVEADGRRWRFRHLSVGNPQASVRTAGEADLAGLDVREVGSAIEHDPRFPDRTNVSFWAETGPGRIRARIWERGVGETAASGTGACGAAVDFVDRGGDSPVTVALDGGELLVAVEEDHSIALTGWAVPVFAGTLVGDAGGGAGALAAAAAGAGGAPAEGAP
jgi:diaminopimelate epimerase